MSKYAELDHKILQCIARRIDTFHRISPACRDLSYALADGTGAEPWRLVDRRMQALRKAGKIAYEKGAWSIVKESP